MEELAEPFRWREVSRSQGRVQAGKSTCEFSVNLVTTSRGTARLRTHDPTADEASG
jgi:hypothetical protein